MRRLIDLMESAAQPTRAETMVDAFDDAFDSLGLQGKVALSIKPDPDGRDNVVELSHIVTEPDFRGQGLANKAMALLTDLADKHDVILTLGIAHDADGRRGSLDFDQLYDWYGRWGFEGSHHRMRRIPDDRFTPHDGPMTEGYATTVMNHRGQPCEVFKNPSRKEWNEVLNNGIAVRAFLVGPDILIWDAYHTLHQTVRERMNLSKDAIPVIVYGHLGEDGHVTVTDNSRGTKWWHNPEVADAIENHPYLSRRFTEIEINYYDEAVVGDWRELDEPIKETIAPPPIVYHGTSNPNFEKFSARRGGLGGQLGYWFASSREAAQHFAKPRYAGVNPGIKACRLRIENVFEFPDYQAYLDAVKDMRGGSIEQQVLALRRHLIRRGFDGVVIRNSDTDGAGLRDDWVAFHPHQIECSSRLKQFMGEIRQVDFQD